jgi:hypothetical protein
MALMARLVVHGFRDTSWIRELSQVVPSVVECPDPVASRSLKNHCSVAALDRVFCSLKPFFRGAVMSEDVQPKLSKPKSLMQRILTYAAFALIAFMIGFLPMWLKARGCASEMAIARRELSLARLQNTLASATIDARRGEYEPARQAASNFFNSLRSEADKSADSALTESQRQNLQPLFAGRDEVITLLARSDPASADRLSDLYASYRKVMSG